MKELENGLKLVNGCVNGKEVWMLQDTGCTTVCISTKVANEMNSRNQQEIDKFGQGR